PPRAGIGRKPVMVLVWKKGKPPVVLEYPKLVIAPGLTKNADPVKNGTGVKVVKRCAAVGRARSSAPHAAATKRPVCFALNIANLLSYRLDSASVGRVSPCSS